MSVASRSAGWGLESESEAAFPGSRAHAAPLDGIRTGGPRNGYTAPQALSRARFDHEYSSLHRNVAGAIQGRLALKLRKMRTAATAKLWLRFAACLEKSEIKKGFPTVFKTQVFGVPRRLGSHQRNDASKRTARIRPDNRVLHPLKQHRGSDTPMAHADRPHLTLAAPNNESSQCNRRQPDCPGAKPPYKLKIRRWIPTTIGRLQSPFVSGSVAG